MKKFFAAPTLMRTSIRPAMDVMESNAWSRDRSRSGAAFRWKYQGHAGLPKIVNDDNFFDLQLTLFDTLFNTSGQGRA